MGVEQLEKMIRDQSSMELQNGLAPNAEEVLQLIGERNHLRIPDSVWAFMPAEETKVKDYLREHNDVAIWSRGTKKRQTNQRRNAARMKVNFTKDVRNSASQNPYKIVTDKYDKAWRQELFTFAIAAICDLSPIEQIAIMSLFDTVGRQHWIMSKLREKLKRIAA